MSTYSALPLNPRFARPSESASIGPSTLSADGMSLTLASSPDEIRKTPKTNGMIAMNSKEEEAVRKDAARKAALRISRVIPVDLELLALACHILVLSLSAGESFSSSSLAKTRFKEENPNSLLD